MARSYTGLVLVIPQARPYCETMSIASEHLIEIRELVKNHLATRDVCKISTEREKELMEQIRVQGVFVGNRERFESMNRAIEQHQLRPAVSRVFPWEEARQAFEHLASGEHFGKICIRIG